ncbi:MAG: hypothetical protein OEZ68_00625 [Gammaproteobacteria bacterium]|nr:hypothetical protein [Gammaproteobacteria bacterium]MDH5799282.1 hypothetical protein [Gammaproteobacteria bacterium]
MSIGNIKGVLFGVVAGLFLPQANGHAGSYQGRVTNVFAYNNKVYVFVKNGNFDNNNTCTGSVQSLTLWLDPQSDYSKAMLSIALTAKTTDKTVWVAGNNVCTGAPSGYAEGMLAIDLKG